MPLTRTSLRRATAQVTRSTSLGIANNSATAVTFDSATYDTSGLWASGQPTRMTVPAGLTSAKISLRGAFDFTANATGVRSISVRKNGTTTLVEQVVAGSASHNGMFIVVDSIGSAGDYYELMAYQNVGGTLNIVTTIFAPAFTIDILY